MKFGFLCEDAAKYDLEYEISPLAPFPSRHLNLIRGENLVLSILGLFSVSNILYKETFSAYFIEGGGTLGENLLKILVY